ncbi:hypothetical protein CFP56_040086 [Quercus suber]|uniref:Uncharacterized protein n=1 Tax=Quercus suber TaxID=58331 RepID=A0AAW0LMN3_QUESU
MKACSGGGGGGGGDWLWVCKGGEWWVVKAVALDGEKDKTKKTACGLRLFCIKRKTVVEIILSFKLVVSKTKKTACGLRLFCIKRKTVVEIILSFKLVVRDIPGAYTQAFSFDNEEALEAESDSELEEITEGLLLCFCCGRVGHKQEAYCFRVQPEENTSSPESPPMQSEKKTP